MTGSILGTTKVVGLIGNPVEHSLSPVIHNAAFRHLQLDYVYVPFPVHPDGLARAVRGLFQAGIAGLNVTVPYKERVLDCLDRVDHYAQVLGAVNTIVKEDGQLVGYNTDGPGFIRSLQAEGVDVRGKTVLVIGAGGAARAVAFALGQAGVREITFVNRTVERAQNLKREIDDIVQVEVLPLTPETLQKSLQSCQIVINTTTVGMYPHTDNTPVPGQLLQPRLTVVDLIYNPLETRLLRAAKRAGCNTVSGLGMLVYQGAASFELWTGKTAPVGVMTDAALAKLNR